MYIKDELKVTEGGKHTTPILKGKTTIELRDAKTGELVHKQVEHNMVTNYFQGPYAHELCGTYTQQPTDLFAQIKGVQLLNHAEEEDASNVCMEASGSAITGYGNLNVNSQQTNTKWMSINQLETGKTQNGYKWVWNAIENQCNGPIECVGLITADMTTQRLTGVSQTYTNFNFERMFANNMMGMFLGKWTDTPGNQNNTTFSTGTFSNIVHIDWENEVLYDIERDYDNDKRIYILRYNLNRDKINLRYRLKPSLIDRHEINFQSSLNHDYVSGSTIYARPFSVKVEGDTMYLVKGGTATWTKENNLIRVIKINLVDFTYTDEVKTLTQTYVECYNRQINTVDKARNFHFIKDYYPIKDGYVYLCSDNAHGNNIYKINLSDVSDITVFPYGGTGTYSAYHYDISLNLVTDQNIFFSNLTSSSSSYQHYSGCLSLKDGTVSPSTIGVSMARVHDTTGFYQGSSSIPWTTKGYHVFADLTDGVLTLVHTTPYSAGESYLYSGLVYIDQYRCNHCMVTINNQSPVVKTSDNTMKVTYELSEATEV